MIKLLHNFFIICHRDISKEESNIKMNFKINFVQRAKRVREERILNLMKAE